MGVRLSDSVTTPVCWRVRGIAYVSSVIANKLPRSKMKEGVSCMAPVQDSNVFFTKREQDPACKRVKEREVWGGESTETWGKDLLYEFPRRMATRGTED